jgi:hypothetical protein
MPSLNKIKDIPIVITQSTFHTKNVTEKEKGRA